jgi:uncharacterized membrane protein
MKSSLSGRPWAALRLVGALLQRGFALPAREIAMPDFDLFNFFRWVLATVVTIYAVIVTVNWALGWHQYLSQPGRTMSMMGRYLQIHGLRLKFVKFLGDLLICLLLCVIFVMLLRAHAILADMGNADVHRTIEHADRAG